MTRVIAFARHGQTAVNAAGRLQGRLDEPLSELGGAQARALADLFASEPVTRVVEQSAACARCDTAAAIAAAHGLAVEVDERLIELDYGEWDGVALADVAATDWAAWRADPEFAPPGGESLAGVTRRVASFLADAAGRRGRGRRRGEPCLADQGCGVPCARGRRAGDVAHAARPRVGDPSRHPPRRRHRILVSFNETTHLAAL